MAPASPTEPVLERFVSRHLQGLVQSDIRRMCRECERLGGINMAMGSCDLPTPALVRDPAIAASADQRSSYTFPEGAAGRRLRRCATTRTRG